MIRRITIEVDYDETWSYVAYSEPRLITLDGTFRLVEADPPFASGPSVVNVDSGIEETIGVSDEVGVRKT